MKSNAVIAVVVGVILALMAGAAGAADSAKSKGMAALEKAAKDKKYAFVFFFRDNDEQTASMKKIFAAAVAKTAVGARRVEVNVADSAEAAIVDKFGVRAAPMPVVIAVAPNGAITGGFASPFTEEQIVGAVATPCTQASLKALQENKIVILCVQNRSTQMNDAAMKGVQDLKADPTYATSTEIITIDPTDRAEAKLLGTLQIDAKVAQAQTVCLVPPGRAVAKLAGATTKEMIAASLKAGSGGGCCPGGAKSCGPAAAGSASKAGAASGCGPTTTAQPSAAPAGTPASGNSEAPKPAGK